MVMQPRIPGPNWVALGAKCIHFRPERDKDPWFDPESETDCIDICNGISDGKICPVRDKCLEYACINNESYGVWGGMTAEQRHQLRQRVKRRYRVRPDRAPRTEWKWQEETRAA